MDIRLEIRCSLLLGQNSDWKHKKITELKWNKGLSETAQIAFALLFVRILSEEKTITEFRMISKSIWFFRSAFDVQIQKNSAPPGGRALKVSKSQKQFYLKLKGQNFV